MSDDEQKKWTEIAYFLQPNLNPKTGQFGGIQANCIGQRSDGKRVIGTVLLPMAVWPEDFDWKAITRDRLETFLNCHCSQFSQCEYHALKSMEWMQGDLARLQVPPAQLPEVLQKHYGIKKAPTLIT